MSDPTSVGAIAWRPDILTGFEAADLPLPEVRPVAGEPAHTELLATLVRRIPAARSRSAVLYVHGWNDYFFQAHLADRLCQLGYDFFAIDLRRCGRSLRPGQLPGYVDDLDEYDRELGLAADVIGADHDRLIVFGHSTGGLIGSLWAANRPDRVDALILNSPWLDLHRPAAVATATSVLAGVLAVGSPTRPLRLPDVGLYAWSVHLSHGGEWDYDLGLKTSPAPPLRPGWLRAVRAGHARVAGGLELAVPVLVLLSARHVVTRRWREELRAVDTVIDVDHIARRALALGDHVTVVRLAGAMHDVVLSAETVRERAFAEIARWCRAYG
ncbi:alpha/beta hydrolase [Microlunatus ginsengisoli]|uniref:Alpha/beta hydrolase n=1 Tax=Microlunatus ginsengisoli TaxID=363863 RepID=A0ABP6ZJ80_9ACTN